ncbi:MAG: hypothetical protein OXL37_05270 [Chloroflexota bacterium]|nr:hypothetical protein [Chloroflexota bacterium]MDE2959718.1 hypothetical protein [Chloroflexota bacterium]
MTTIAPDLNLPPDHPLRQILDTIAAHPEVREPVLRILLTEDLLALPEQVRELRADLTEFREETREQFRTVNERIDETNQTMQEQFQQVNERIDESRQDVIRRMNGFEGRFRGETYERKCAEKIDSILVDHFRHAVEYDQTALTERLVQARHDRLLTSEEYQDARNVDIVAYEKPTLGVAEHLAVVEVSITFNRDDLETAARRAAIIGRVFGLRTDAFVATNGPWPEEVNEVARQLQVTVVRYFLPEFAAE